MNYRIATIDDLEKVWDKDILRHMDDPNWKRWKREYIEYNKNREAITFVAENKGDIIAQISVVLKNNVKAVLGKPFLVNSKTINMNGFRCDKAYEGQGHISKLVKIYLKISRIFRICTNACILIPKPFCILFTHFHKF